MLNLKPEVCYYCNGTGKFKQPINEEAFDIAFDHYDDHGYMTLGETREKALEKVGYTLIQCPKCNGTGYI